MAAAEGFAAVLEAPGERGHGARSPYRHPRPEPWPPGPRWRCRSPCSRRPRSRPAPPRASWSCRCRRRRSRSPSEWPAVSRPMATSACLSVRRSPGQLVSTDGRSRCLGSGPPAPAAGQAVGQLGDARARLRARRRPPTPAPGRRPPRGRAMARSCGQDLLDGAVQVSRQAGRGGAARRPRPRPAGRKSSRPPAAHRGRAARRPARRRGRGLAARRRGRPAPPRPPARPAGSRPGPARPASGAGGLRRIVCSLWSRVARAATERGLVGGVGADGGVDLGRAGGVDLPGLFRDAGDGEAAQPPRGAGVGLDAVAELDRLGCRGHAPDGGGGVEVVAQQGRVQRLPAAPGVAHDTTLAIRTWS